MFKKILFYVILLAIFIALGFLVAGWLDFDKGVRIISVKEAKEKIEKGEEVTIVDVRTKIEYEQGHLPGAISIPLNDLSEDSVSNLNRSKEVIVYCNNDKCSLSAQAAKRLEEFGFERVANMKEGIAKFDGTLVEEPEKCELEAGVPCEVTTEENVALGTVLLTGLIDGINPCAIGMILFLLGYLVLFARQRKRLMPTGILYILFVFLTYFIMGIAFFAAISALIVNPVYYSVSAIINLVFGLILILAGLINLKDYFWYGKGLILRIPESIGPKLQSLVEKVSYPAVIMLAILVTIFEAPCSLPLYLGTVRVISLAGVGRATEIFYLILYNLMFILPLIVAFLIVKFGRDLAQIKEKEHELKPWMKLIMAGALIILGIALIV